MNEYTDFLHRDVEVPQIFLQGMENALAEISASDQRKGRSLGKRTSIFLPKAAVIVALCVLVPGISVLAANMIRSYWARMTALDEREVAKIYEQAGKGETTLFSRPLSEEEKERYLYLKEKYLTEGVFPEQTIREIEDSKAYDGVGIALDSMTRTIYLPNRELADEELLQIIDLNEKIDYSIRITNQVGYGKPWRERLQQLTAREVDEIYFTLYSGTGDVSGGYNRVLTDEEQERYEELSLSYEEKGMFTQKEIAIFQYVSDYSGQGVAICIQDGNYYLPERTLSDEELLMIIDWQHKGLYCLERINQEVDMGIRTQFPKTPYHFDTVENAETASPLVYDTETDFAATGIEGTYLYKNGGGVMTISRQSEDPYEVSFKYWNLWNAKGLVGTYDRSLTVSGTDENGSRIEFVVSFEEGKAIVELLRCPIEELTELPPIEFKRIKD